MTNNVAFSLAKWFRLCVYGVSIVVFFLFIVWHFLPHLYDRVSFYLFKQSLVFPDWKRYVAPSEEIFLMRCAPDADRLIVYLHTWGTDYSQVVGQLPDVVARSCVISPNFNGKNRHPSACGSNDAVNRIKVAIDEARRLTGLRRVNIVGASGGGYAALMFLGKFPGVADRASVWVPIYDLARWYSEATDPSYLEDMRACFGSAPASADDPVYRSRSPSGVLDGASGPLTAYIVVGTKDVLTPPKHGVDAFQHLKRVCEKCKIMLIERDMGHQFVGEEAVRQILEN